MPNMAVNLGGIKMRNPLNTASGTFGNGVQFEGFYDVGATLGAITCKGVAAEPFDAGPASVTPATVDTARTVTV